MENASKALLIAGSILIVILLIAVGVRIFNSTSGTTDQVDGTMQSTEVVMFNSKFTKYVGEYKSKSDTYSMLNEVIANNATNERKVGVWYSIYENPEVYTGWTSTEDITTNCLNPLIGEEFIIKVFYDDTGYIDTIYYMSRSFLR